MHYLIPIIVALLISPLATAENLTAVNAIKYRKSVMVAIKGHNLAIKSIVRGHVPFKEQLPKHIAALEDLLNEMDHLFPAGSDVGETDAKSAIWNQPKRFLKASKKATNALAIFKNIAANGSIEDTAIAYKKFSKTGCGGCHKPFRKKSSK